MRALPTIVERLQHLALDQPETLGDGDCEALRAGLLGQPANTVSSFAYIGAGAWLAARVPRLSPSRRRGAVAYAALVALTGAGSIAYHGPQFPGAQLFHDVPIFGALGLGMAVPFLRRRAGHRPLPGWSGRLGASLAITGVIAGAAYVAGGTDSPVCRPESLLQAHGLWHLGTAATLAMWGAAVWAPEPSERDSSRTTVERDDDLEDDGVAAR